MVCIDDDEHKTRRRSQQVCVWYRTDAPDNDVIICGTDAPTGCRPLCGHVQRQHQSAALPAVRQWLAVLVEHQRLACVCRLILPVAVTAALGGTQVIAAASPEICVAVAIAARGIGFAVGASVVGIAAAEHHQLREGQAFADAHVEGPRGDLQPQRPRGAPRDRVVAERASRETKRGNTIHDMGEV